MSQCTWCGENDAETRVLKEHGDVQWFCCGVIEVKGLTTDEIFPDLNEKDWFTRRKEIHQLIKVRKINRSQLSNYIQE